MIGYKMDAGKITGSEFVIIQDGVPETRLDRKSIILAIGNVKERRSQYATTKAYQRALAKYEGALQFFDTHSKR